MKWLSSLYLFISYYLSRCTYASMCEGHRAAFRSSRDPIQIIMFCGKAFYVLLHLTGPEMSFLFVFVCCNKVSQAGLSLQWSWRRPWTSHFTASTFWTQDCRHASATLIRAILGVKPRVLWMLGHTSNLKCSFLLYFWDGDSLCS